MKKNKKANQILDILGKLMKKKQKDEQNNIPKINNQDKIRKDNIDDDINESEIEKEAERIAKKEKKMEERRKAKAKLKKIKNEQQEKKENININNKNIKKNNDYADKTNYKEENEENTLKQEEKKRRKQFAEDIKAKLNDYNKDDESTVNNTSKSNLINNISNYQISQMENEEKNKNIDFNINPKKTRNLLDEINKKEINHWGTKEIIINDASMNNLDRSFDTSNAYMKRKIPAKKSTCNIYKPKKPDIRKRSPDKLIPGLIENNSSSFNPNQNINYNNLNNGNIPYKYSSKLTTYIKKKSSFNDNNNFLLNNSSFCKYTKDNINVNLNSNRARKSVNMDIDFGSPLNTSFDAYMKIQRNNFNNNISYTPREPYCGSTTIKKHNNGNFNKVTYIQGNNLNNNQNYGNIFTQNENNIFNSELNRSFGYGNNVNNIFINNNNNFSNYSNYYNNVLKTKSNIMPKNKISNNQRQKYITYNNSPLRKYINQSKTNQENNNYNYNNNYQNSPNSNIFDTSNNINKENLNNNYNNNDNYGTNNYLNTHQTERNTSINIEDLMVLEEKLNEIITALNKNHVMHNECFEFWNYYYNCSFYGKLEKLFKSEEDSLNVQKSINHILISVMICYDFSFEMEILNNEYSILVDILELNHRNLIIIYEHILSKISSESKSNPWVYKLHNLVNNFDKNDDSEYILVNGRKLSSVEKIMYNVSVIVQNIRVLLKNYKTKKC